MEKLLGAFLKIHLKNGLPEEEELNGSLMSINYFVWGVMVQYQVYYVRINNIHVAVSAVLM